MRNTWAAIIEHADTAHAWIRWRTVHDSNINTALHAPDRHPQIPHTHLHLWEHPTYDNPLAPLPR